MIYIGTSGYYYKHWRKRFYPLTVKENDWLKYYSQFFSTVELNVTFYRLPQVKAFETWRNEAPENFVYSVKGSRYITHVKKLNNIQEALQLFMDRALFLQNKLGIVLWQFPQNFHCNLPRLEDFLQSLSKYKQKNAFEFRHESWFTSAVYELLNKYQASLVIADSPKFPLFEVCTSSTIYIRYHGGKILYGSNYSSKELKYWAKKILLWSKNRDIFVYFNNDNQAFAVNNAIFLKELIENTNKE